MKPQVFVTGAAGCIGSRLCTRLAQRGHRVTALVRDKRQSLPPDLPGIEFIEGDITNRRCLRDAMRGCDWVFHAAARVHAPSNEPAEEFARINIEGTRHVIEAALEHRIKSLVFFSTVAVYAETDDVIDESYPPAPTTPYGHSKFVAERLVLTSDMKTTVLRFPIVYGPRDRGNMLRLIQAIKRGRYLLIGNGANLKSLVAVENVVDAALLVAETEKARGQIYLVCDERPYTQREIAETIAELLGRRKTFLRAPRGLLLLAGRCSDAVSRLTGFNLPISADRVRKLSNNTRYSAAKIERELGFKPRVTLRDGLAELL